MKKTLDVSVVGLSCVDCIATGDDCQWHVQNPVGEARLSAGGIGNALTALSGLGLRVGASTRIGADMYGDFLLTRWRESGIDTRGAKVDENRPTGFAFIVDHGGERTPFYSAGSNAAFCLEDIPARIYEESRCLLVFFAGALPSFDGAPLLELVMRCQASETTVILDASDSVSADYRSIGSYLPYASSVINQEEGRRITGQESPRLMLEALVATASPKTAPFVAVTRPDGVSFSAVVKGRREYLDFPSPFYGRPVRNVVGAGDAFRAGLAAFIARHHEAFRNGDLDYRELCLFASAVAYAYLSRTEEVRPFGLEDIRRLLAAA